VRLMRLMVERDVRPVVDSTAPLEDAAAAFRKLAEGDVFGKIVLTRPA
jgi:NADPH:quinone reductase-like Zn-dependent oxidoreductase